MIRKDKPTILRLDNRTAILSALSLNIFFVFVQLIIIVYSYHMGVNIGAIYAERFSESNQYRGGVNPFVGFGIVFLVNTFSLYLYFRFNFWIISNFSNSKKRSWLLFLLMTVMVGIFSTVMSQLLAIWLKGDLSAYHFSVIQFIKDFLLYIASVFFSYLLYLILKNQEKMEENKNLVIENFKNRYNALKSQTDPHFLFNSLNSLNGLIGYDDERAHEYVVQLSSVFRYIIQERPLVTLAEELEFTESYIYLMKIRYGDAFTVEMKVCHRYREYPILPFAIQTLVENAVKHNIVSRNKPLKLVISTTDDEVLVVENNLQLRMDAREGSGLGLSNLNERYSLVFKKQIHISQTQDNQFRVEIPLVKRVEKLIHKMIH